VKIVNIFLYYMTLPTAFPPGAIVAGEGVQTNQDQPGSSMKAYGLKGPGNVQYEARNKEKKL
jgi:hypothetical protein